jgi:hypothetical protein
MALCSTSPPSGKRTAAITRFKDMPGIAPRTHHRFSASSTIGS